MHISANATTLGLRPSVAGDLAMLSLTIAIGLAIGAIRFRSLKLGISGVLFSALLFGQAGVSIDAKVIEFLSNFALIIFMYALGLQVGPGFGASLRAEGFRLNALALCVIVLGALMTAAIARLLPSGTAPGLYSGAFIATPALAAAQETLRGTPVTTAGELAAVRANLAYSITYPFGVVGPMLLIVVMRRMFRVRLTEEAAALIEADRKRHHPMQTMDIEVTAPAIAGTRLQELPRRSEVIFSRVLREDVMTVPTAQTLVQIGDVYRAVGPPERLAELVAVMGRRAGAQMSNAHGDIDRLDLVVTRAHALHRSLRELDLIRRTGVTIARVHRSGVELVPTGSLRLAFADQVTAVGPKAGLRLAEAELGNCLDRLQHSQLFPIFLGIVLGVAVGSIPLAFPGIHGSIRIGLAGGSLLSAIALSRLGSIGAIVWYMPAAANQLLRDFGMAIFLACVGLQAGDHFIQRASQNSGLLLFGWGCVISIVPVFVVACFARLALRMNFISLSGFVAGAIGNSSTLLFAEEISSSNAPAIAFAAVAPLAELAPIICAQVLAIAAIHR